jgi:hypothetical protein
MFTHPDQLGRLARENHRQLLAQASKRQLARQRGCPAPRTQGGADRLARRLAVAIARAGAAVSQGRGAIWPAVRQPVGDQAGQTCAPVRGR